MTNKKDKKKKNKFIYTSDDANDITIDFAEIGESIKRSVNNTIRKFADVKEPENLPQTRNKEVCEQVPPDLSKAKTAQVFKYISFVMLFITSLTTGALFLENIGHSLSGSAITIVLFLISLFATFAIPYALDRVYKENIRLTNNYVRYLRELGNNTVISIRDLASAVAQSEEDTVDDLLLMMKRGYFKQARIVENDSLFILDIPTFRLYKEKREEVPGPRMNPLDQSELSAKDLSEERAKEIIYEGRDYIKDIENTSKIIDDREFSILTDRIVDNSKSILQIVEKYPDKSYALNKFSDYYLPTTAKLVETYHEFDMMNTEDKKIKDSMGEIRKSLVTIAEAFDKIKVDLLSDRAMDIKTDIDTINLLLNQEGYTEDDWRK